MYIWLHLKQFWNTVSFWRFMPGDSAFWNLPDFLWLTLRFPIIAPENATHFDAQAYIFSHTNTTLSGSTLHLWHQIRDFYPHRPSIIRENNFSRITSHCSHLIMSNLEIIYFQNSKSSFYLHSPMLKFNSISCY